MADTPESGETVVPATPSNEPSTSGTPAPPAPVKTDDGEVEKLRKEIEQAKLRERQLANQNEALQKAEADRKALELESQNEFKTLYEQEKAKRETAESEREAEAKKAALKEETDKLFADYDPKVKALADDLGFQLADTDEASRDAFKAKLEKLKGTVTAQPVTPNNPKPQDGKTPQMENEQGIIEAEVKGAKFDELVAAKPGIASLLSKSE